MLHLENKLILLETEEITNRTILGNNLIAKYKYVVREVV